jgi:hypothetical protein
MSRSGFPPPSTPSFRKSLDVKTKGDRVTKRGHETKVVGYACTPAVFEIDHGDANRAVELSRAAYTNRRTVFTADALGWALTRAGRATEAMPYMREATSLGTASVAVQTHAAAALAATGDADAARQMLQRVLDRNPWTAPSVRTAAVGLARSLGMDLPEQWRL